MKGCDAVVHLASVLPLVFDGGDGVDVIHNTNVVMSWNALRAAAEVSPKSFILPLVFHHPF